MPNELHFPVEYLAKQELEAWHQLGDALHKLGAVTADDLAAKYSERKTPGQKLLALIRVWGEAQLAVRTAKARKVQ
jgi:hypothetical protein